MGKTKKTAKEKPYKLDRVASIITDYCHIIDDANMIVSVAARRLRKNKTLKLQGCKRDVTTLQYKTFIKVLDAIEHSVFVDAAAAHSELDKIERKRLSCLS